MATEASTAAAATRVVTERSARRQMDLAMCRQLAALPPMAAGCHAGHVAMWRDLMDSTMRRNSRDRHSVPVERGQKAGDSTSTAIAEGSGGMRHMYRRWPAEPKGL